MNANGKNIPAMTRVTGGGSYCQGDRMASWQVAGFQIGPESFTRESSHTSVLDVEDGLGHPTVPEFGLSVGLYAVSPLIWQRLNSSFPEAAFPKEVNEGQLYSAKRTLASLPVQSALV